MNPERFPSPDCVSASPPFIQGELIKLSKAQDRITQKLTVQKIREKAVKFDLMVPEWTSLAEAMFARVDKIKFFRSLSRPKI